MTHGQQSFFTIHALYQLNEENTKKKRAENITKLEASK